MIRFAFDAITGFSYFPLQVAVYASLVLGVLAVVAIPIVALLRLTGSQIQLQGQATTLVVLLLLSSFQFFFFFILGQYLARVYDEVRQRPHYIVAEVWGDPWPAGRGAVPVSPLADAAQVTSAEPERVQGS
jgi:dolichol-phosphate mannosyltransferase